MEAVGVGEHDDPGHEIGTPRQARVGQRRAAGHERVLRHHREVDAAEGELQPRGLHGGELGEVVDHPAEPGRLLVEGRQRVGGGLHQAVAQLLEAGLQHGERGPQLVGDVRGVTLTVLLGPFDLAGGRVEGVDELGQLGPTEVRHADGVVAGGEGPGRGERHLHRGHQATGGQRARPRPP